MSNCARVPPFCIPDARHVILNWSRFAAVQIITHNRRKPKVKPLPTVDCHPITVAPGLSRLFTDYCAGDPSALRFYGNVSSEAPWQNRPANPAHWSEIVEILARQNSSPSAAASIQALRDGAGTILTGQQVGLLGGPLYTPFKAATAIARARQATAAGRQHAAIFWLAGEDHDFAEINNVTFPFRRELRKLIYEPAPDSAVPVGGILLDETIQPLLEQAGEILGWSDAIEALNAAYQPGRTFAQAFADFYSKVFAAQGLLIFDASDREVHRLGAPVLRAAVEQADELNEALVERGRELVAAGYHAQVAEQSSLLFLIDRESGARVALKRIPPSAEEPGGLWQAGRERCSASDLLGILESEPERMTPIQPRFSATLIEPDIAELLRRHELTLDRVFAETQDSLAQLLAARALPIDGKRRLAAAGNAFDEELTALLDWMHSMDAGLGRSGDTAAEKMRYQMNRLRRLAADFQLQKESSLARHAQAVHNALFPGSQLQERVHGAAFYFARNGFQLAETLVERAADTCPSHIALWL